MAFRWLIFVLGIAALGCSNSHLATDGSITQEDSGIALMDSGPPPVALDAATMPPLDGGPAPSPDSGPPPVLDAGPPRLDAGTAPELDAGPAPGLDAGPPSDAGSPGVLCDGVTCAAGEICCANFAGGGVTQMCSEPGACTGATIACDGPEDCSGGDVCCISLAGGGGTMCSPAATCTLRACRAETDCSSGERCCPFMGSGYCSGSLIGCFP